MTHIIEGFQGLDLERTIALHTERFTRTIALPFLLALQANAALPAIDFHHLRRAGIKREPAWKDHTHTLTRSIRKQHGMRHAFAVKVDIRLFHHAYIIKLLMAHINLPVISSIMEPASNMRAQSNRSSARHSNFETGSCHCCSHQGSICSTFEPSIKRCLMISRWRRQINIFV